LVQALSCEGFARAQSYGDIVERLNEGIPSTLATRPNASNAAVDISRVD
jgi:hypothetical protein